MTQQQTATLDPPKRAVWFGIEIDAGTGDWARLDDERLGGAWWRVGAVEPQDVAKRAGPGLYRVVWAPKDRRRSLGPSLPFEVPEAEGAPQQSPPATAPASPPDDEATAAQPAEAETEQTPEPEPSAPGPEVKTTPKKANGRRAARATDMPTMDPAVMTADQLHPLGQTVYLQTLAQGNADKFHAMMLQAMHMIIESERARSDAHTEAIKAHYKSVDDNRSDLMRTVLALTQQNQAAALAAAAKPPAELAPLADQIVKLTEQVEDLQDMDEQVEQAMTHLSQNPNDLERALAAFQNIVGMLAQSPIGQALAAKLEQPPIVPDAPDVTE